MLSACFGNLQGHTVSGARLLRRKPSSPCLDHLPPKLLPNSTANKDPSSRYVPIITSRTPLGTINGGSLKKTPSYTGLKEMSDWDLRRASRSWSVVLER